MDHDYQRVAAAIQYLNENTRQQPSLAEVAKRMHLSPGHAQRLFSRWAGISPKQFLQFLTVQHAKRALARSQSLLALAHSLGLSGSGRLHDHFITLEAMTPQQYRSGGDGVKLYYDLADTPFGSALMLATGRGGICHLSFVEAGGDKQMLALRKQWPQADWQQKPGLARRHLQPLFDGGSNPAPITLQVAASNFRLQVWQALLRVPEGSLVSYQQLAGLAGHASAVRAVASAVAANPVAWLIPCHRVIRASGEFGQYRWSTPRKQALIAWEAARIAEAEQG
jgi:AraC family transcriptional regulator of adaptative response/methylated-DNA-[protein]-cysteine methyltransferase